MGNRAQVWLTPPVMLKKRNVLPPLDYLLAFESAANKGGFAGASRDLNISETAISRKVKLLELHYDVPLFVRGHRSITLTPQGHTLLAEVTIALDRLRAASQDMFAQQQKNAVTLAATNSVASLWLMPRLHRFNAANARVKINLVASDDDDECLADSVDVSILRGEGDWPGYNAELLFGETIFPVCSPDYLAANPRAADVQNYPELHLIDVSNQHIEWMNWKTWLAGDDITDVALDRATVFNTFPLSVQAAVDGLGIALGWGHLVDHHLESGALIRPLGDNNRRTQSGYYLLSRKDSKPFPERDIVTDWLKSESAQRRRYAKS